jgi:hypothetical protein
MMGFEFTHGFAPVPAPFALLPGCLFDFYEHVFNLRAFINLICLLLGWIDLDIRDNEKGRQKVFIGL